MKTLHEILLNQYQEAKPRLDRMHAEVIRAEQARIEHPAKDAAPRSLPRWASPLCWVLTPWRELFWSSRRVWVGMAAVWAAMILFNLANSDSSEKTAPRLAVTRPAFTLASQQQQLKLIEQMTDSLTADFAEPPRSSQPSPRSDRRQSQRIG